MKNRRIKKGVINLIMVIALVFNIIFNMILINGVKVGYYTGMYEAVVPITLVFTNMAIVILKRTLEDIRF